MLPTEVCEFQIPKMRPFLPFPNQLATTVTTLGQPVVWKAPPKNWIYEIFVLCFVSFYFSGNLLFCIIKPNMFITIKTVGYSCWKNCWLDIANHHSFLICQRRNLRACKFKCGKCIFTKTLHMTHLNCYEVSNTVNVCVFC